MNEFRSEVNQQLHA